MPDARLFPLAGATRDNALVRQWFTAPPSEMRAVARRWFDAWRACGDDVEEVLHDGHPTACVRGIALGYVAAFTAHVNVGFFLGATLPDPAGLLLGTGKFMRHVKVGPTPRSEDEPLRALMRAAYQDLVRRLSQPEDPPTGRGGP